MRERTLRADARTMQQLEGNPLAYRALLAFGQPDLAHAPFADTLDESISAGHRRLETGIRKCCACQHFDTAVEQIVAVAHGRRLDGGDQPFNLAAQVPIACASLIKHERTLRVGPIE